MSFNIFNAEQGASYDAAGQKIEKPIEAVVAEPPAPVIVDAPVAVPPPTDTPIVTSAEINWEERTGGKFKSWDEIDSKLKEQPTPAEIQYANEQSKTIAQYISQGKLDDVRQVLNDQHRLSNADKLAEADAVKLAMEFKNTQFDFNDINEEFAAKYIVEKPIAPIEDEFMDDDAYKAAQKSYTTELKTYEKEQKKLDRQLKIDAVAAREELRSLKSDIVLPDITPIQATTADTENVIDAAAEAAAMAEFTKNRNNYLESLNKSADEFKSIPFTINDEGVKVDVNYMIDAAEIAAIRKDLTEKNVIDDILLPRYDKDGVYNTKQLIEDIYFLNNREKIVGNAIKQAIAQDRKLALADRKNINLDGGQRNDFTPSTEAALKEFSKSFLQAQ